MNDVPPSRRPNLDSVTLVAVTSVAISHTVHALRRSMAEADFAHVLLISDLCPPGGLDGIRWIPSRRLNSRSEYSRFMLRDLATHVTTNHALCVQWDGFVINGAAWTGEFLNYDYLGAIWPHVNDGWNVGNGGFSLRSRQLLEACRALPIRGDELEDVLIGRVERPRLERMGIRFAPEEIARRFSYERTKPTGSEFGFHGAFNLVRYLSRVEAERLFSSLEPGMLARNERWELLRWALIHGRPKLAAIMMKRLMTR